MIWEHCVATGASVLDRQGLALKISLDLRRQRHARHTHLRQVTATRRRRYRGMRRLGIGAETMERWEADLCQVLDGIDVSPRVYL